jgi:hypothetical protein
VIRPKRKNTTQGVVIPAHKHIGSFRGTCRLKRDLSRVAREFRANVGKGSIDSAGHTSHARRGCESNERNHKRILNQILPLLTTHQILDRDSQFPHLTFQVNPPLAVIVSSHDGLVRGFNVIS